MALIGTELPTASQAVAEAEGSTPSPFDALEAFHGLAWSHLDGSGAAGAVRTIVDGVAQALPARRVELITIDRSEERVLRTICGGDGESSFAGATYGELMSGWLRPVFADRASLLISAENDATEVRQEDSDLLASLQAGSVAVVPLAYVGEVVGIVAAVNDPGDPPLTGRDVAVLGAMANQAAVVIQYARRLESEQRQRKLAMTLQEVTAAMTSTLDLRTVLDGVLEGLAQVFSFDIAALMLRQDDSLRVMAARGFAEPAALMRERIMIEGDETLSELFSQGKPVVGDDWLSDDIWGSYAGTENVKTWMGVPLVSRNRVIGVLTVGSRSHRSYEDDEVTIVDAFADQAAVAIQNARLFQRTSAALARTEILYHTAQALIASDSLTEVLQSVVDGVARAIPADRVSLVTVNMTTQRVIHFVRGGPGKDRVVAVDFDELWDGLSGYVLRERMPILSSSGQDDEREGLKARSRRQATDCGAVVVVPLRYRGKLFGTMTAINRPNERDFTQRDVEMMATMANQAAMAIENARLFDEVQRLAVTDDLTGLSNRRGFFELAQRELDRAERTERPVTALMLDIDGFKKVNDTHGHAVGDEVLRQIADRCRIAVREVDLLGRYGGEEFAFLLPETDTPTAVFIADRVRTIISGSPMDTEAGPLVVRVSIGVAPAHGGDSVAALLDRADTAMYNAKTSGGDVVKVAESQLAGEPDPSDPLS